MADLDQLKDHDYDGIQEYDNDLPRWWLAILWLTIAWAGVYVLYYHLGGGLLGPDKLRAEVAAVAAARARNATGPLPEDLLRELSRDSQRIARGKALFDANLCASCHGLDATGLAGPNLRDDWWMHGSTMTAIVETISDGRSGDAMPAQKSRMSPDDIISLACYVVDLNRRKAPGKAPDPAREREAPITW